MLTEREQEIENKIARLIVEKHQLRKENEELREALEAIAFGRVEGDYGDVRQYAREALEEEQK